MSVSVAVVVVVVVVVVAVEPGDPQHHRPPPVPAGLDRPEQTGCSKVHVFTGSLKHLMCKTSLQVAA